MSFDGTDGDGLSLAQLLGLLKGSSGPDPGVDPIPQALADIAQRARLPKVGGLFGGGYARFMADNAPPSPFPNPSSALGVADPMLRPASFAVDGEGGAAATGRQAAPGARPAASPGAQSAAAVGPRVVNADTGQPYNDAQEATFGGMIDRGEIDPSAQPGSRAFPRGMPEHGAQPSPGEWYVDLDGRLAQAPGQPPPAARADTGYHSARRGEGVSTVYTRPDGTEDVYVGGTMAWRNNNPGNLKDGDFARRHGAIGSYKNDNGKFAVFPDEATGVAALRDLLTIPKYQRMTVDEVIKSYAPHGQNNTAAYQAMVRGALGVDGSTRLGSLSADQLDRLVATIRKKEGAKAGTINSRPAGGR